MNAREVNSKRGYLGEGWGGTERNQGLRAKAEGGSGTLERELSLWAQPFCFSLLFTQFSSQLGIFHGLTGKTFQQLRKYWYKKNFSYTVTLKSLETAEHV